MTRKSDIVIVAGLVTAFLVFAAWIVGTRVNDEGLPSKSGSPASFSDPELNLPDASFSPPLTQDGSAKLPILSAGMPEFRGIVAWLNSAPLMQEDLRGKVVLIDFWTYSCINCIRTLPYITSWYDKYEDDGLIVIGVHTPEFAFEEKTENVRGAINEHGIRYPVAQDNDYDTWTAYNNRYWPAKYLFDAEGRLRYTHFGEGEYDKSEANIVALLKEAGYAPDEEMTEVGTQPDFRRIGTPETYLGYGRMEHLGSPEGVIRDEVQTYTAPSVAEDNTFYFEGAWRVEEERAVTAEDGAAIIYRYDASAAHLVIGPPDGKTGRVRITVDGEVTRTIAIDEETLYTLHETKGVYGKHTLKIEFLDAGMSAYAFTFG